MAKILKRWVTHSHVYAKRQRRARELVPYRCKAPIRKKPFTDGSKYHRRRCTQPLHFIQGPKRLYLIAHRQKSGPSQSLRRSLTLASDITIVRSIHRGLESGIGSHMGIERGREKHLNIDSHAFKILKARLGIRQVKTRQWNGK